MRLSDWLECGLNTREVHTRTTWGGATPLERRLRSRKSRSLEIPVLMAASSDPRLNGAPADLAPASCPEAKCRL